MMIRASLFLLAAVVALTAPLRPLLGPGPFGSSLAFAASESEEDLISRGVALRKAGSDQEATEVFRQAYQRFHSPRSAAQLGLSQHALGRWDDAEAYIVEALRADGDPWVRKNRDALTRALAVIKEHIARLEVLGTPDGAEVLVNGHVVGRLPMSAAVGISAGEVDVETRAPGYKSEVRKLELKGGQYQRLVVRLEKPATTATTAPATGRDGIGTVVQPLPRSEPGGGEPNPRSGGTPEEDQPSQAGQPQALAIRKTAKWVALGLAVGGLGVGVGSTLVRSSKLHELSSHQGGPCLDSNGRAVDGNGNLVPACQGALDTYRSARPWPIVGFVSAGVFAATWLVLLLTEPDESTPAGTAQASGRALSCGLGTGGNVRGATCAFAF
jgi:hypothetical protein